LIGTHHANGGSRLIEGNWKLLAVTEITVMAKSERRPVQLCKRKLKNRRNRVIDTLGRNRLILGTYADHIYVVVTTSGRKIRDSVDFLRKRIKHRTHGREQQGKQESNRYRPL
jgi:hypothetical protein